MIAQTFTTTVTASISQCSSISKRTAVIVEGVPKARGGYEIFVTIGAKRSFICDMGDAAAAEKMVASIAKTYGGTCA